MSSTVIGRALSGKFTLIAEIGVNYYDIARKMGTSPMDAAKLMVKKAKGAGVHAVKFQSYKAQALASKNSPAYWDTEEEPCQSQYELFSKFDHFGREDYQELKGYCGSIGIEFLSTAFDYEAADYLQPMVEAYKISSSDLNNLPFIEYQARKGKPMLMSTGAAKEEEIDRALQTVRRVNSEPVCLMHCVLEYPTPYGHANLDRIAALKEKYGDAIIGYSDHTKPDVCGDVIKTAYSLGALVVEKHFTLDKALKGNDHYHAMDPTDAEHILKGVSFIHTLRGSGRISCMETEHAARLQARRSLVLACPAAAGTRLTREMVACKRPGTGIPPDQMGRVVGRRLSQDLEQDTVLTEEMFYGPLP